MSREQYIKSQDLILEEMPPINGKDQCQDWLLNCVVGMEVEGVINDGTAEFIGVCVGLNTKGVKQRARARWVCISSLEKKKTYRRF